MDFALDLFLRALGLALVLEGLCWALFPGGMRRLMTALLDASGAQLRFAGLMGMAAGLLIIAAARFFLS